MIIGGPKEFQTLERRAGMTPAGVRSPRREAEGATPEGERGTLARRGDVRPGMKLWPALTLLPFYLLTVACGPTAPPKAPEVSSGEAATTAKDKGAPAETTTAAKDEDAPAEATTAAQDEGAPAEAPPQKAPPKSYTKSRWNIGKVNASEAADTEGEDEPVFVIDLAAQELGLARVLGGGSHGCDFLTTIFEYKKGKAVYQLGWSYPAPAGEVAECDADVVRPENKKLSPASVREVDAPAGIVLWVKTDNGDKATAKKLFDAVFTKK